MAIEMFDPFRVWNLEMKFGTIDYGLVQLLISPSKTTDINRENRNKNS